MLRSAYLVANRMMRRVFGHSQPFALPLSLSLSHFVQKGELVRKSLTHHTFLHCCSVACLLVFHSCGFLFVICHSFLLNVDGHCHHCLVCR